MNVINNFFKDENDDSNFIMVEVEDKWPNNNNPKEFLFENPNNWMMNSIRKLLDAPDFIKDFHDMLHPLKKMIRHREFKGQSPKLSTTKKAWHNILLRDTPKIVQKWHDLLHPFNSDNNGDDDNTDVAFETDDEDDISNEINDDKQLQDKSQEPNSIERDFQPNPNSWIHKDLISRKGYYEDAPSKNENDKSITKSEQRDYEDIVNPWFTHHNEIKDIDGPPTLLENDLQNKHPDFIPDLKDGSLHPIKVPIIYFFDERSQTKLKQIFFI